MPAESRLLSRHSPAPWLLPVVAFLACGHKGPSGPPAVPVRTAQAALQDVPLALEAVGSVEPVNAVVVYSRVAGQVLVRHFQEGQQVKEGDLLFTIDPAPYEAKAQETEAAAAREEAALRFAQAEAARMARLAEQQIVSSSDRDRAETQAQVQKEAARTAREAAVQAKLNLDYCQVRSPLAGQTGAFQSSLGATVEAYHTPLVAVNQLQPIHVSFSIPEADLTRLRAARASGMPAVAVASSGVPLAVGRLSFIDNAVDRATGMLRLKAAFPNADQKLWPGQFVDASLVLSTRKGALAVPAAAVMATHKGSQVFVLGADGVVELRPVVLDVGTKELAVVKEGLRPGETVVVEGQNKLRPGSRAKVIP